MKIDYSKYADGLVPAIVQDFDTDKVLMLGFMNEAALLKTEELGRVTFYSRTKQRLWTKGEASGNFLELKSIAVDCDNDTLLIKVHPKGPVCHTGADTCWMEKNHNSNFLNYLEDIIALRKKASVEESYVARLFAKGLNKMAQKVGEEAVETVIATINGDREEIMNESADLIYHLLVLLKAAELSFYEVLNCLKERDKTTHL